MVRSRNILLIFALLIHPQIGTAQDVGAPSVLTPPGVLLAPSEQSSTLPSPIEDSEVDVAVENLTEPEAKFIKVTPEVRSAWYQPSHWFGPAPWDIGFELGLNGSDGINETFSMRTGGHLRRKTDFWKIDTSISYHKNTSNKLETQNDAKFDARFDRALGKSPWSLFLLTNVLYDEFQPFDIRFALNSGVGYQFIDTDQIDLIGRFGGGTSREFGGPDVHWTQEALFGTEYEHKLSKTQRLTAKADYFPVWKDFDEYRIVSDLGWEIDLDRPKNVSLRLSVQDRYDSTSNGTEPNNLDYAVLLIWGL